ncbi:dihydrofolate reductase [Fusibacter sp. JL216-2]|uniref:dihydrofolate reductase n=1 Tax=Fusibacter sp. JL216-2 TaxID=3071453 RepID=UPI003D32C4A2
MANINIIVAIGLHNEIGLSNALLCHIKPDLEYFKKTTKGHIMIMGRKTFLSLPNGPLSGRDNIIITRQNDFEHEGAHVARSIEESLEIAKKLNPDEDKEIFIIGGGSIYEQFMPLADKLYITHIFQDFEASVYFPKISQTWEVEQVIAKRENIEHMHPHVFTIYKKKEGK